MTFGLVTSECGLEVDKMAAVESYTSGVPPHGKRKKTGHGLYCAVAGCKSEVGDGITVHRFPKDEVLRRKWTKFVQLDRANFGTPNLYSAVCYKHFSADCYPLGISLMTKLGFKAKRNLLAGSIPSIRPSPSVTRTSSATGTVTVAVSSSTSCSTNASCSLSGPSLLPGVKKVRGAYRKRELSRVCTLHCFVMHVYFLS
jgi:hypothetical protein